MIYPACKSVFIASIACILIIHGFSFCKDTTLVKAARPDTLTKAAPLLAKDTLASLSDSAKSTIDSSTVKILDTTASTTKSPIVAIISDTTSQVFLHPYFNIGMGWSLGSFPLFTDWQNALPDSAKDILPLNPDTLAFTTKEPVTSYNILLPLYMSYTPYIHKNNSLGFEASLYYFSKNLQATLRRDSSIARIDYKQTFSTYAFSLGAIYRQKIDEQYFKIDKVDQTSFILGLSLMPFIGINRTGTVSLTNIADTLLSPANRVAPTLNAIGQGIAWRIGIGSQQALSPSSGMEVSVSYVGRYAGFFKGKNGYILNKDINPAASKPNDRIAYFFNTVEIKVEFCFGKKPLGKKK